MSQTDDLLQDLDQEVVGDDLDGDADADREPDGRRGERSRGRGRIRGRLGGVFSPRGFLLAFVLTLGGFLLGSAVPLVGAVPFLGGILGLVGIFAAGFLLGTLGRRGYLELLVAGAATAGVGLLLDQFVLSIVADLALPLAAVGATAGALAAVLGHYFGRDLRDGATRSL
ncbi:hypothetical protein ACFQE8_16525 [Salinirubellus sp. GCM10025818]|jgi:VIT1/CCC1 family predicted Fe2+/Mn2+ transporter|uniref:hypothetical protein n=1 Tax=Salinirubellus TaxID=2162630 RepID=UPI0030D4591D